MSNWNNLSTRRSASNGGGKAKPPTVTFAEAAEKLGVKSQALVSYMRHYPEGAPAPCLVAPARRVQDRRRFHMADFHKWWATIPKGDHT